MTSCRRAAIRCDGRCECDEDGYCLTRCTKDNQCACGESCYEGKCRTRCSPIDPDSCPDGKLCISDAVCIPGCRTNQDCSENKECRSGKCINPCEGACGVGAICRAADHRALCLCPDGYRGEPSVSCKSYECDTDDDCDSEQHCFEKSCRNPCLIEGACGQDAQCRVIGHRAHCTCPPDFFGNPSVRCQRAGQEACLRQPCGTNAM